MASLISIPLKKSYDVDLVKPLVTLIASNYNASNTGGESTDLNDAINFLNKSRANCVARTLDVKHESSLEVLEKYYDQLVSVENKIPTAAIQAQFKWKDAFDRGGSLFSSSNSVSISNLSYDKVCILFNIGALYSQLACSLVLDATLTNDIALKKASKQFQIASGIFQALKHITSTAVGDHDLTSDLSGEVLTLLEAICLAQAQEMFYYKASNDNLKPNIIAQIANQCEHLYGDAMKQIQLVKLSGYEKEWLTTIALKQHAFKALAEYYQSLVAKQNKDFGEVITRLQKSTDSFKLAESKASATFFPSHFRDSLNTVQRLLDEVRKDNDFIYHAKIPDYKALKVIGNAQLTRATPLPAKFHPNTPDLFEKLLPVAVQDAMARFEIQKQETINTSIATLREQTNLLNGLLASMNLPAALEDTDGVQLPPSLKEKADEIKAKGGLNAIEKLINDLPDASKRNREIVDETERQLLSEEESDNTLRSQFKEKWTRTPSTKLNANFKEYIAKYKGIISNGLVADEKIKEKYLAQRDKIKLLSSDTPQDLLSAIPTDKTVGTNLISSNCVKELKNLMKECDEIKSRRQYIEEEIKKVSFDDLKARFLSALAQDGAINQQALSTEAIGEAFGNLQREIRDSIDQQAKIVENVRKYNDEYVSLKRSISDGASERETFLIQLATAGNAYLEIMSNLNEGTHFYNDLTTLLVSLQSKVNDFCFARQAEKEDHCKHLQNEIISQTATQSATPITPSYHTSAPVKPPRPPPPQQAPNEQSQYSSVPTGATAAAAAASAPNTNYNPPNPYQPYYAPPPPLPTAYNPYYSQGQTYPTQQYPAYPTQQYQPGYPQYPYPQQQPPQAYYPFSQQPHNPYPPQ